MLALTSRLFILRHHPSFPDPELAPERDALNCIRILTRILPYLYESESLSPWEERFFWGARRRKTRRAAIANEVLFDEAGDDKQDATSESDEFEDVKPLAEELIDTLIDLLFFSDLTISRQPHGHAKVTYAIWQSGVGCNAAVVTTKEYESNRCEILRLLLALTGQSMYITPAMLPQRGVRTLTHLCTYQDKQVVLSVLCSLLNTVCPRSQSRIHGEKMLRLTLIMTDAQVQPGELACSVQHVGVQGRKADLGHIFLAVDAYSAGVSNSRTRIRTKEPLSALSWSVAPSSRLPIHS